MSNRNKPYLTITWLLCILLAAWAGAVQADQRAGPDPMRKAQFMLRQMATEKAALAADKAKLEQDIKALQKKYDRLEKKLAHTKKNLERSRENGERLVGRIGRDNDRIREYVGRLREQIQKYRDTVHDLRVSQLDNRLLVKAVKEREDWIATCRDKNEKLYQAGDDILEAYKHQGFWSSLTRESSPVGMSRVAKENQEQTFQFRLEDLQSAEFKPKTEINVAEHTQPEPVEEVPPQEVIDPTEAEKSAVAKTEVKPTEAVKSEEPVKLETPPAVVAKAAPDVQSPEKILKEGSLINEKFMQEAEPDVLAKVAEMGCRKTDSLSRYVVEMPHGEVGERTWRERWTVSGCGASYPIDIEFMEKGATELTWKIE